MPESGRTAPQAASVTGARGSIAMDPFRKREPGESDPGSVSLEPALAALARLRVHVLVRAPAS